MESNKKQLQAALRAIAGYINDIADKGSIMEMTAYLQSIGQYNLVDYFDKEGKEIE